jgi:hypothetical protein
MNLSDTGPTELDASFSEEGRDQYGAYYVDVERIGD